MTTEGERRTGRFLWPLFFVLVALSGYVMLSGALREKPNDDTVTPEDAAPVPEKSVELLPGTSEVVPAKQEPVDPAPVEPVAPAPIEEAEPEPIQWQIEFTVENAPRWHVAIFRSTDATQPPERTLNALDGPASGTIAVIGPGQLYLRTKSRLTWVSEALTPPSSGTLSLTATLQEGLSISGTVTASDGTTPIAKGQVRVRKAAGKEGVPYSEPFNAWVPTDNLGRYHIAGLNPGTVKLIAVPYERELGRRTQVEVEAGQRADIRLEPIGLINLRILDAETQKALRTESIQVHHTQGNGQQASMVMSGVKEGTGPLEFVLRDIELGKPTNIRVRANGYEPADASVTLSEDGGSENVTIALRRTAPGGATFVVRLSFVGGETPTQVWVKEYTGTFSVGRIVSIQEDQIELSLAPDVTKIVIAPPVAGSYWLPVTFDLTAESTNAGVALEHEAKLVLGGHVTFDARLAGADKATFAHANASFERVLTHTRARGERTASMTAHSIPPGTWTLTLDGDDQVWNGEVRVEAGKTSEATWTSTAK